MSALIPDPDPAGLPAPAWLLKFLLVFTFVLHLLPMNLVLGGGLIVALTSWRGRALERRGADEAARAHLALAAGISHLLPVSTAFTITFGVAPLLFLQVLYGQLFYTSSVLMAWPWLAVIPLVLVAYYGYYGLAFRARRLGRGAVATAWMSTVALLAVAFLFTSNLTLMLRPGEFQALYAADDGGLHLHLDDPTLLPRFLHFVVAALAFTGLLVAYVGKAGEKADARQAAWIRRFGVRLFVGATLLQMAGGVWFLLSLPGPVRQRFLGGNPADTGLLVVSAAFAVLALLIAGRSLVAGTAFAVLAVAGMACVRHLVRAIALAPDFSPDALALHPQTAVFLAFAVLLVAGIGVVAWMLTRFLRGRTPGAG